MSLTPATQHKELSNSAEQTATSACTSQRLSPAQIIYLALIQGPRSSAISVPEYRKEGQSQAEICATELQKKSRGNAHNSKVGACTKKALSISASSQAAQQSCPLSLPKP